MWTPSPCLLLQTPTGKATGFFPIVPQFTKKSVEHLLGGWPFLFSGTILSTGRCWLGSRWPSALWGPKLPSIQISLDGLISGQCKFFVSIPRYFVIWGSNKFESVIPSLSVPWISRVLIRYRFWFQFHTPGQSSFSLSQAIYTGHSCGSKNNPLRPNIPLSFVYFLPFCKFEVMENNKRPAGETFNGSTPSCQRLRRPKDAFWGTLIASDQRANFAQPLGSSLVPIRRQFPRHSRQ